MSDNNSQIQKRPSGDSYYLKLAHVVKERSNCFRLAIGAVIVQGTHIIATGYNGTPKGTKNCNDGGCERCSHREQNILKKDERKDLCICVHAELNAILQSSYHGVSSKGGTLYSTIAPCIQCAKAIINAGITTVVYEEKYQDNLGIQLLQSAGLTIHKYSK